MMHSDSRVKEPVCLATTSLPDPCLSTYLSPRFREEPKKWGKGLRLEGNTLRRDVLPERDGEPERVQEREQQKRRGMER